MTERPDPDIYLPVFFDPPYPCSFQVSNKEYLDKYLLYPLQIIMQQIADKVTAGERITGEEFLLLADKADLYQLGFMANAVRKRLHPKPVVTYIIDRNINYTDICISACKFCAFFKAPEDPEGKVLSKDEL
ncbi:MAG: hypothetical protein D3908_12090, partial [Candidatus Electrothrix sp. AUS4]|nr:hypothetical protein [Candidatus Electrothrix sp. AUS4]